MNNRLFLTIWSVIVIGAAASGQTAEQVFAEANQLYQQGKVAEARDKYEIIAANGYVNGELYYNLGNAYYRLGDLGRAILNYERGLRLMPGDEDLRHNRQLAGLRIVDRIEQTPRLFIWEWWDRFAGAFSVDAASWTLFILFSLVCAAAAVLFLGRGYALRKWAVVAGAVSTILCLFALIILVDRAMLLGRSDEAIVVASITTLKNSPDPKSTDAFVLHAGVKVLVLDSINEWLMIRLPDGKIGWMERGAAETI